MGFVRKPEKVDSTSTSATDRRKQEVMTQYHSAVAENESALEKKETADVYLSLVKAQQGVHNAAQSFFAGSKTFMTSLQAKDVKKAIETAKDLGDKSKTIQSLYAEETRLFGSWETQYQKISEELKKEFQKNAEDVKNIQKKIKDDVDNADKLLVQVSKFTPKG